MPCNYLYGMNYGGKKNNAGVEQPLLVDYFPNILSS